LTALGAIELREISKRFSNTYAVCGVKLNIAKGAFVCSFSGHHENIPRR
jgi:ABC-type Fe3+/spermidine/putrescine transport system ATPase subunit